MDKQTLNYIRALEHDRTLLLKALEIAGQYARDNLPAGLPEGEDFATYVSIYANGRNRDPEGKEFVSFWAHKAKDILKI